MVKCFLLSLLYQKLTKSQMSKRMEISIIFVMFAIVGMIGFSILSNTAEKQRKLQEIENEKKSIEQNKINLDLCLKSSFKAYQTNWNNDCALNGMADNCGLSLKLSQSLEQAYASNKADCFRRYPVN